MSRNALLWIGLALIAAWLIMRLGVAAGSGAANLLLVIALVVVIVWLVQRRPRVR